MAPDSITPSIGYPIPDHVLACAERNPNRPASTDGLLSMVSFVQCVAGLVVAGVCILAILGTFAAAFVQPEGEQ